MENIRKLINGQLYVPFAERIRRSIEMNFEHEGRPNKWEKSQRAKAEGGRTLSLSGKLRNSISYKISGDKITFGTNIIYAKIHQFGGHLNKTVTVKEHERNIKTAFGKALDNVKKVTVKSHSRKMNTKIKKINLTNRMPFMFLLQVLKM